MSLEHSPSREGGASHNGGPALEPIPIRLLYPVREACVLIGGVSHETLYKMAREKKLTLTKIGRRTFVSAAELQRIADQAA